MSTILEFIHKALVSGALAKGWGGPVCRAAVPISTHIVESLGWVVVSVIVTKGLKLDQEHSSLIKKIRSLLPISFNSSNDSLISTERKFELVMSSIHFLMFLQLVYYKSTIMSLINLLQPCHVILLLQGIALYSTTELGIIMSLYLLPTMTGTLLAMILPDTTGLDQLFELESYWLQHYIIQVIPLYLLCRKNFLALKVFSFKHIVSGLVIMALLHFVLYEIVDLSFNVNVEFMLCPTDGMISVFSQTPAWVTFPTYRTTMTFIVIAMGLAMGAIYVGVGHIIKICVGNNISKKQP